MKIPFCRVLILAPVCSLVSILTGCQTAQQPDESHAAKPSKVEKLPGEGELTKVTLTPEAKKRLGITVAPTQAEQLANQQNLFGEVLIPAGKTLSVNSPVAGTIVLQEGTFPVPGGSVEANQTLFYVRPLLSVERDVPTPAEQVQMVNSKANLLASRTVAEGDVQRWQAEVDAAKIALDRATKLFEDRAGARRGVDDAEAQLKIAQSNLDASQNRQAKLSELISMLDGSSVTGEVVSLPMESSIPGVITQIPVRVGQTVNSGTPLFQIADLTTLWVRVPVFVDQLEILDRSADVTLTHLSGTQLDPTLQATPAVAPPTADPATSTVDLYYSVENKEGRLIPGQRLGVRIPTRANQTMLTIPVGAVLYDIHGNTWVYQELSDGVYMRVRVAVQFVKDGRAALSQGPAAGTTVVVDGAAELFGTEFGAGK